MSRRSYPLFGLRDGAENVSEVLFRSACPRRGRDRARRPSGPHGRGEIRRARPDALGCRVGPSPGPFAAGGFGGRGRPVHDPSRRAFQIADGRDGSVDFSFWQHRDRVQTARSGFRRDMASLSARPRHGTAITCGVLAPHRSRRATPSTAARGRRWSPTERSGRARRAFQAQLRSRCAGRSPKPKKGVGPATHLSARSLSSPLWSRTLASKRHFGCRRGAPIQRAPSTKFERRIGTGSPRGGHG